MPIATPMSARLSAGASLTPSPVMATNSPLRLQRLDDADLLLGRDARVDAHACDARARARRRPSRASSAPREHARRRRREDAERARDGARGGRMVAGDHHRRDAGGLAQRDRLARLRPRRIEQADQPEERRGRVSTRPASSSVGQRVDQRRCATASTRSPSAAMRSAAACDRVPRRAARRPRGAELIAHTRR